MWYTQKPLFFYFQDSAKISVDPNRLSDFLMTCKKTLKENHEVGSNEYVKVLFKIKENYISQRLLFKVKSLCFKLKLI